MAYNEILQASLEEERGVAQRRIDREQLRCIDLVDAYSAIGGNQLSVEEGYAWFMALRSLAAVPEARSRGYAAISSVRLEQMDRADELIDTLHQATVLEGLEPSRRQRRKLANQKIAAAFGLLRLHSVSYLGNSNINMTEYEMDSGNYRSISGDEALQAVTEFVYDWHEFQHTNEIGGAEPFATA